MIYKKQNHFSTKKWQQLLWIFITKPRLTSSNLYISAENPSHRVAGDAPVGGAVHVLSVGSRRKGQQHQGAILEESPDPGHVAGWESVRGRPVDVRGRTTRRCAVQPRAAGVWELDPRRRLYQETGTPQVGVEAVAGHRQQ